MCLPLRLDLMFTTFTGVISPMKMKLNKIVSFRQAATRDEGCPFFGEAFR